MIGIPTEQEQTQNSLQAINPWNRIMQGNDKHKQNSSGGQACGIKIGQKSWKEAHSYSDFKERND